MLIKEYYDTRLYDGVELFRTYSDKGFYIVNESGIMYDEAVDIADSTHTYTESDVLIEEPFNQREDENSGR